MTLVEQGNVKKQFIDWIPKDTEQYAGGCYSPLIVVSVVVSVFVAFAGCLCEDLGWR